MRRCAHGRARRPKLRLDGVGRHLPDAVEPVDEDVGLRAAGGILRPERRGGPVGLEMGQDDHGVDDHAAVVLEHRNQLLAADGAYAAAVRGIVVDPVDREVLVGRRERHALHVGGERDPMHAQHGRAPAGARGPRCCLPSPSSQAASRERRCTPWHDHRRPSPRRLDRVRRDRPDDAPRHERARARGGRQRPDRPAGLRARVDDRPAARLRPERPRGRGHRRPPARGDRAAPPAPPHRLSLDPDVPPRTGRLAGHLRDQDQEHRGAGRRRSHRQGPPVLDRLAGRLDHGPRGDRAVRSQGQRLVRLRAARAALPRAVLRLAPAAAAAAPGPAGAAELRALAAVLQRRPDRLVGAARLPAAHLPARAPADRRPAPRAPVAPPADAPRAHDAGW